MVKPRLVSFTVVHEDWGEDIDNFLIEIQVDIGPDNSEGADTFKFRVISPKRLDEFLENNMLEIGRGNFIMKDYNISVIQSQVNQVLERCHGDSWSEVALLLSRYLFWEYEF